MPGNSTTSRSSVAKRRSTNPKGPRKFLYKREEKVCRQFDAASSPSGTFSLLSPFEISHIFELRLPIRSCVFGIRFFKTFFFVKLKFLCRFGVCF